MISVADAQAMVAEQIRPLGAEAVPLGPALLGRRLTNDVSADRDLPPFPKAMMDGFAVRTSDCRRSPVELAVTATVTAGQSPSTPVRPGETHRIMTGAPLPEGADAVVMREVCVPIDGDRIRINLAVEPGQHVQPVGKEMHRGQIVVRQGTRLHPVHLAVMATVGQFEATVYRRPRVAVLSTGDELVEPTQLPGPGEIRNSNGPMLTGLAQQHGALASYHGIAPDDPARLRAGIESAMGNADVLLLSGGVSVGDRDFVPEVFREVGVTGGFHKVKLKPGKPLFFGQYSDKLVFGLPGNPVSAFVGFTLFVRPALTALAGGEYSLPRMMKPMAISWKHQGDRPTYFPAVVDGDSVKPTNWHGAPDLLGLCPATALLVVPEGEHQFTAGQLVPVIPLMEW